MTTLTLPTPPEKDANTRPLPWQRMAWVTWRHHRIALGGVAVFLGALAVWLWIAGLQLHHAYAAAIDCHPAGSTACSELILNFRVTGGVLKGGFVLQPVPALIGAFVGPQVLARELETGTFRYAWTQGFGRARWAVAKLIPLAVAVTVAAGAFSVLVSWYIQPIFGAGDNNGPLYPTIFDLRGVALAAWTLAAFAIGALAGILIRRVIPAMFATFAVWAGLAFVTGWFLRRHYEAPLVTTNPNFAAPAWVISRVWTRGGQPASLSMINQALRPVDVQAVTPGQFQPGPATPASIDPVHYLIQHGYTQLTTYQPDSRFWPFQWIEGGWLLALSVLLIATTLWLVRRRAA